MRFRFSAVAAICAWLLLSAQVDVQFGFPPGTFQDRSAIDAPAAASYTGPGDCSGCPTLSMWGGLRAYSAAKRGSAAISLCDDTGANCADASTDATTGILAVTSRGSNSCATSDTCRVKIVYDQSGNTNCGGSACDLTNATNSERPTLKHNCIGSLYCLDYSAGGQLLLTSGNFAFTTGTFSVVVSANAADNGANLMYTSAACPSLAAFTTNVVKLIDCTFSTGASVTVAAGTFHGIQAIFNGASSSINVNGTANAQSLGSTSATNTIRLGDTATKALYTEAGVSTVVFSGPQATAMNSNQQAFWGY